MLLHTVAEGDCFLSIAYDNGFFWETLWNHPNNKDLRKLRKDPNCLFPGDVVFVPDKRDKAFQRPTGKLHQFRLKGVPARITIQLLYCGEPRKNERYKLKVGSASSEGKTDNNGMVRLSIPPNAKEGTLVVGSGDFITEYTLDLGYLDPVDETQGVQCRLQNLGYYAGPLDGTRNDDTIAALKAFQKEEGKKNSNVKVTGTLDKLSRDALLMTHDGLQL